MPAGTCSPATSTTAYGLETTADIAGGYAHDDPFDGFGAQYGYYADHKTGLILCGQRYYDAGAGRWISHTRFSVRNTGRES